MAQASIKKQNLFCREGEFLFRNKEAVVIDRKPQYIFGG